MNKLRLLPVFILALLAAACKKEDKTEDPNAGSSARFRITGVKDIDLSLSTTGTAYMPIQIVTNAGAQPDTVNIQVTDLPRGIRTVIEPANRITTFASRITFLNEFNGPGGTFPVKVLGIGNSGTMTYPMNLTIAGYLGWTFNDTVFSRATVVKEPGRATGYPYIYADATNGSRLIIHFPHKSALPTKAATYKIGASATNGNIQVQFVRDSTQIFVSTGVGAPTATFSFDSLGKFIFRCTGVEMSNGIRSGMLSANLPE